MCEIIEKYEDMVKCYKFLLSNIMFEKRRRREMEGKKRKEKKKNKKEKRKKEETKDVVNEWRLLKAFTMNSICFLLNIY